MFIPCVYAQWQKCDGGFSAWWIHEKNVYSNIAALWNLASMPHLYVCHCGIRLKALFFPSPLPGEQGLRGESRWEHSPPNNVAEVQISASTPYVGQSLLLVLSLAPIGFSSGTPVFPSPEKPALQSKFQFHLERTDTFKRVHKNSFVGKQITIYNLQSFRPFHHLARVEIMLTG